MTELLEPDSNAPKLGLALSGGGFRASFYHLGVLAKLAEQGILKHVEVISCVSGGSIIGAMYYLYVKKLVETDLDCDLSDQDYIRIVADIESRFLHAVQKNLRMRTFLNPYKNLKMSLASYSRSDHIGELYDKYLYRGLIEDQSGPVRMKDLIIKPVGHTVDFHPLVHNKYRTHKVPILLLNATVLNNGHHWRFEAARMGEPARDMPWELQMDKSMRLERPLSYDEVPRHADFPLGTAVAASSCVPGIFPPLSISGMYDEHIRLQLVDGGVHDNQGIQGLLEPELGCTHFMISDASGQLDDAVDPSTSFPAVLSRSNAVMMDRIRQEQLTLLHHSYPAQTLFLHLRHGLPSQKISLKKTNPDKSEAAQEKLTSQTPSDQVEVDMQVQHKLSKLRTDLDAFTEVEAFALMMNGYSITDHQLKYQHSMDSFKQPIDSTEETYQFLKVAPLMKQPTPQFLKHLNIGSKRLFKVFYLSPIVTVFTLALVIALGIWLFHESEQQVHAFTASFVQNITVWTGTSAIILLTLLLIFIIRIIWAPRHALLRFLLMGIVPAIASVAASIPVLLHLMIFNRLYITLGKFSRLKQQPTHVKSPVESSEETSIS